MSGRNSYQMAAMYFVQDFVYLLIDLYSTFIQ